MSPAPMVERGEETHVGVVGDEEVGDRIAEGRGEEVHH